MKNKAMISILFWSMYDHTGYMECYQHKYLIYLGTKDSGKYLGKVKSFTDVEKFLKNYFKM